MTSGEIRRRAVRDWTARFRAWADAEGIRMNRRGRIPVRFQTAYAQATGDDLDEILARLPPPPLPPPAYSWLREIPEWQHWNGAGTHGLTWVSGVDPAEVFALYPTRPLGEHRFGDVEGAGGGSLAGGTRTGEWSFIYEPTDTRLASSESVLHISRELHTTVVAFWQIGSHRDRFIHARDGNLLVEFDPVFPDDRYGTEPEMLTAMTEVGLLPVPEDGPPEHSALKALELARRITGVHVRPEVLSGPFQWVRFATPA